MMELHAVARMFDNEPVYDGYGGAYLFDGQVRNFNDASSTGATLRRRVLSVAPDLDVPARRVVRLGSKVWLAGIDLVDTFQGEGIRKTYNLRYGMDLFNLLSPGEVCVPPVVPPVAAYAYSEFFKAVSNTQTDSELDTFWNVFFAPGEPVSEGRFLQVGSRLLRVRQAYLTAESLRVAEADELDADWSQELVFDLGVYDPVLDTYTNASSTVRGIQMDLLKFYRWRLEAEAVRKPGDRTVFVPTSLTPKVGANFTMLGATWQVLAFQRELDTWALHVRLA